MDFADLVAQVRPLEKVAVIITAGDLLGEHARASEELATALRQTRTSLADGGTTRQLAEQVSDLEARIAASTIALRFRGLGRNAFRRLVDEHPAEGAPFNPETFPVALIAACSVDPAMTPAQAAALADVLSDGQWDEVFDAAWSACREVPDGVPFNVLASATTTD